MSPFKKITQQLGALDLKSPDLEDFATPMGPAPDLWPQMKHATLKPVAQFNTKSPSTADINTISSIQNSVKNYTQSCRMNKLSNQQKSTYAANDILSCSLPVNVNIINFKTVEEQCCDTSSDVGLKFSETHFDVNGDISTVNNYELAEEASNTQNPPITTETLLQSSSSSVDQQNCEVSELENSFSNQLIESKNEILCNEFDENGFVVQNCSIVLGHNGAFLDTKVIFVVVLLMI